MDFRETPILLGTASGTFLSAFALVRAEDVLSTLLLAAFGATISFLISWLLDWFLSSRDTDGTQGRRRK
jgi:multisubunit Na+/H+ antiporter MnhG subunit